MRSDKSKGIFWATVVSNQQIRTCYSRIVVELEPRATPLWSSVTPGQFAMLDLTQTALPPQDIIPPDLVDISKRQLILRRPFSFSDVSIRHSDDGPIVRLELMYCVLGPSTLRMTSLTKGDKVSFLGPLGNGFKPFSNKELSILVAGGMGAPPILHLASVLKTSQPGTKSIVFAGSKSCDHLPFTVRINNRTGLELDEFQQLNVECHIATDDGSAGFTGYVTSAVEEWLRQNTHRPEKTAIYACGPELMLFATARLANKYNIDCQVSMERMMACGVGLCQSCVVEHKTALPEQTEYKLCCQDGPVFDSRNVVFGKEG